eukprot:gene2242-2416_t
MTAQEENDEHFLKELTKEERGLVEQFKSKYQDLEKPKDDPGFVINNLTWIRFLKARKWKLNDSIELFEKWIKFRKETKPHEIKREMVLNEIKCEKGYWFGQDKEGCPIIVVKIYNHDSNVRIFQESINYALYMAETGMSRAKKNGKFQYVILYDATNVQWKNMDIEVCKEFYKFTELYPETLKRMYVIQPCFTFSILYKLLSTLVDSKTMDKIVRIDKLNDLHQYIDPEYIQKQFGGESDYIYDPQSYE